MQERRLVSVDHVVRHADYVHEWASRGKLTLRGSAMAWRTGETAARLLLERARTLPERQISVQTEASPTTRTQETSHHFLSTFLSTKVSGGGRLIDFTHQPFEWPHPFEVAINPALREGARKTAEVADIFRNGDRQKIEKLRERWMRGEDVGLETAEETVHRFRFLSKILEAKPAAEANQPIQVRNFLTHGWIMEKMLEKLTGKSFKTFGDYFEVGEGFAVYTYSDGTKEIVTLRLQEEKIKSAFLKEGGK